jgi:hypothetical protein
MTALLKFLELFGRAPDFVIGTPPNPYLLRWHIIPRNRFFNIYLHRFCRSDDDRALHDHPWWNASILLTGSYVEHCCGAPPRIRLPWRPWRPHRVVFRRATAAHRIQIAHPVWTLFLTGPKVREWGFHCPSGWRHWRDFVALTPGGNTVGRGCD